MLLVRGEVEAERRQRREADVGRPLLRVRRVERREAADVTHVRRRRLLLAVRPEQPLEPALAHRDERPLDRVACRGEHGLELAQRDLLLLLVTRDRVGLLGQVRLELLVRAQQLEPLLVELGRLLPVELAELVALLVVGDHREPRERRAKRQLLALEGQARGEDRVLELVVLLGQLGGDEPALARLAQPVEPLALVSVRAVPPRHGAPELVAAEEVGVASDDRRLLGNLLLADADGPALLRPLVEIALELFLELRRAAYRGRRHLEDSIRPRGATRATSLPTVPGQLVERERLRDDRVGVGALEAGRADRAGEQHDGQARVTVPRISPMKSSPLLDAHVYVEQHDVDVAVVERLTGLCDRRRLDARLQPSSSRLTRQRKRMAASSSTTRTVWLGESTAAGSVRVSRCDEPAFYY